MVSEFLSPDGIIRDERRVCAPMFFLAYLKIPASERLGFFFQAGKNHEGYFDMKTCSNRLIGHHIFESKIRSPRHVALHNALAIKSGRIWSVCSKNAEEAPQKLDPCK